MKSISLRTFSLAAFLLAASLLAAPSAHAQFGIAGGANFDRLSDVDDGETDASFENATGYHVGVFYDFAVGPIGVRPGVFYMDVGSFQPEGQSDIDEEFDLSLIEIPLDLRYRIALPFVKPYLTAGPVVRFVADGGDSFGDSSNDFSVAGNAGLGVDFGLPATSLGVFIEGRYSFGISPIAEDFNFGGAGFSIEDDTNLNTFMLRAGVKF